MRLYHYLETEWALDDITKRHLRISQYSNLNDPYELESVYSHDILTHQALGLAKDSAKKYGLLCFSRTWDSVLMWSHYAEKHCGMCLGFDVPDEATLPVKYVPSPEDVGNLMVNGRADFDSKKAEKIINRIIESKYEGWQYEKEVRIIATRDDQDEETKQFFYDFNDHLVLKEIIGGARCSVERPAIEKALAGYSVVGDVRIIKARICFNKYEIVEDERGL